ncbi:helix-turn-helix domain-containing protein [Budviciaceae bacterium BWR-B9]|uniref:Helix-turn-helix domain-containing protein n=1 Tax=Limnobaculum allomyrinae TaxID=2791986 RepID=A0ABS1IMZ6_9GAMM|nr:MULTISPECIES: winged helix-turn-helix transcriptional regulator [Limnobaculum]MBK5143120.1 helix-turn-helix domain-containing protein [Limnobaculum allomyrinae]MBV7691009.1 helix-turn-helix domain-containing protein [Limnobaculum sp. M2-1]
MDLPLSSIKKPIDAIQILIDKLSPYAHQEISPSHKKFYCTDQCYLVQDGYVQLHRIQDEMIMYSSSAPTILGLSSNLIPGAEDFFFTTKTTTTIAILTTSKATQIIESENLWEYLSIFQAYIIRRMHEYHGRTTALSAYEITRNQLINLMHEPDEVRNNITAVQYIQDHTRLSRSGVMKMLSQLKKGNYIELNKGLLIKINKMPLGY